jgi:hypothetical protein
MKKFFIIGVILAGVAVCVLLACTSVSTMAKGKPRLMVITLKAETGEVFSVTDENGDPIKPRDPKELVKKYEGKHGFRYVGTVLHSHSSPGCITFKDALGFWWEICWPEE